MLLNYLLCLLLFLLSSTQQVYTVDTDESTIRWTGKKIFGSHYGTIPIKTGQFRLEGDALQAGSFTLNVREMTNQDLEGSRRQDLLDWLKSEEMFYTEKYPEASFNITNVQALQGEQYRIEGELTIKGITQSIGFPARIRRESGSIRASAFLTFDRTRWDLNYGEGGIIGGIGNSAIKDEVEVDIELVARADDA
jgi:polyisoprenoid-binding protein YceI